MVAITPLGDYEKKLEEKDGVSDAEHFGRVLNKIEIIHLTIDKEPKNPQSNLFHDTKGRRK